MDKGSVIDQETREYLAKKLRAMKNKVRREQKFKKRNDWKEFRAAINKKEGKEYA